MHLPWYQANFQLIFKSLPIQLTEKHTETSSTTLQTSSLWQRPLFLLGLSVVTNLPRQNQSPHGRSSSESLSSPRSRAKRSSWEPHGASQRKKILRRHEPSLGAGKNANTILQRLVNSCNKSYQLGLFFHHLTAAQWPQTALNSPSGSAQQKPAQGGPTCPKEKWINMSRVEMFEHFLSINSPLPVLQNTSFWATSAKCYHGTIQYQNVPSTM